MVQKVPEQNTLYAIPGSRDGGNTGPAADQASRPMRSLVIFGIDTFCGAASRLAGGIVLVPGRLRAGNLLVSSGSPPRRARGDLPQRELLADQPKTDTRSAATVEARGLAVALLLAGLACHAARADAAVDGKASAYRAASSSRRLSPRRKNGTVWLCHEDGKTNRPVEGRF